MSSQDLRMARMRSRRLALVRGFQRRLVFRRLRTMSAASPKGMPMEERLSLMAFE